MTANDINREPTGALGTVNTPTEMMMKRETEREQRGESKLVLQYFSSPADTYSQTYYIQ